MRALFELPTGPNYRHEDFAAGLQAAGYQLVKELKDPTPEDIVVLWNRQGWRDNEAKRFERAGAKAVIAENGYLGKLWQGKKWFSLSIGHHSGAGIWPDGGPERWDSWGVEIAPWRYGTETVILEQRGIGAPGIASPHRWAQDMQKAIGGRIRSHPGASIPAVSLVDDLKDARCVVTWHSGAALHALLMGVPVFYGFDQWIGADAARHVRYFDDGVRLGDRLAMFRRLAWAMWTAEEVKDGTAFSILVAHR